MSFTLLFSGQGAQKPKMGLDFMVDPLFKEIIEKASAASKQNIVQIFKSENGELNKTVNVQPALVAFEAGIFAMLKRDLPYLEINSMVGLSLGEYGAMFASEALDLANTIALVGDRARYMQVDADKVEGSMIALVMPKLKKVNAVLTQLQNQGKIVSIANYNSPRQIVIGGEKEAVMQARQMLEKENAALKIVALKVNGAFHTSLFQNASQKMHERLKKVSFKKTKFPVISNTTVKPLTDDWASVMEKQLSHPTHFGECLQYLLKTGDVDATLEIGPGKTLSAFAKQIDRKLTRYQIGTFDQYQKFIEEQNEINR